MDPIPAQHNECETFHWATLAYALDDIVTDFQDNSELKSVVISQRCCCLGVTVERPRVQIRRIFDLLSLHFSYFVWKTVL
jgi:hypothetical protein